jgi:uncharacterized integral membrane protein
MPDDDRRDGRDGREGRDARDTAKLVGVIVPSILLLAFVVDNTKKVSVGFVVTDFRVPLIFVLAATALLGALIDRLYLARRNRR